MILAAGRGERLKPLTTEIPKPLVSESGKPLIQWQIERLARAGVTNIIINHAWLGHKIEDYLQDGLLWGVNIQYSRETGPLGTGGGIKHALPLLGKDPFILISGDITTDYPFKLLLTKPLPEKISGHLIMVNNPDHHPQGDYYLEDSIIRPRSYNNPNTKNTLTFGSIALLHPRLFHTRKDISFSIAEPFNDAVNQGQLSGEHFFGYHCNVDTIERLQKVERDRKAGLINEKET